MDIFLWILLVALGLTLFCEKGKAFLWFWGESSRVKLSDVQNITLTKGEMTAGRRSPPIPQLTCFEEGSAGCRWEPEVIQCYNRGLKEDGLEIQWECQAEMYEQYKFGPFTVSCEGYEYLEDPFILRDSCGLEYNLVSSRLGAWACMTVLLLMVIYMILTFLNGNLDGLRNVHPLSSTCTTRGPRNVSGDDCDTSCR